MNFPFNSSIVIEFAYGKLHPTRRGCIQFATGCSPDGLSVNVFLDPRKSDVDAGGTDA